MVIFSISYILLRLESSFCIRVCLFTIRMTLLIMQLENWVYRNLLYTAHWVWVNQQLDPLSFDAPVVKFWNFIERSKNSMDRDITKTKIGLVMNSRFVAEL